MDVIFKYNKSSKWKKGRVADMRIGKNIMCKIYVFEKEAKVLDWENTDNGLPTYKKASGWFFKYWLPIERIKFL